MCKQIWTFIVAGALATSPILANADPPKRAERRLGTKEASPAQRAAERTSRKQNTGDRPSTTGAAASERSAGNREMSQHTRHK
jgi:hypothetical protein